MLLSGCSSAISPSETASVETQPELTVTPTETPTTESTTEPTLSAEELFLQSLPDKLRQAHELGLVELSLLEDLERPCTIQEAAGILQNVYGKKFGEESWMLTHTVTEKNAQTDATRGWFMTMMYAADAETLVGVEESESYSVNLKELTKTYNTSKIADALLGIYDNTGYVYVHKTAEANRYQFSLYGKYPCAAKDTADISDFSGDISVVSYALTRFDRTTGEKLMHWDEKQKLHFKDSMTVQEVVETALRYYNALEPKPDMIPYDEIPAYDKTILSPDLLLQDSSLPEPSCQQLPAQWHGITLSSKQYNRPQADQNPNEHEVQAIKDAGFNLVLFPLDFSYYFGRSAEEGKMNENRLKELDQLLAWCIERDMHLNLACYWCVGWPIGGFSPTQLIAKTSNADALADSWAVLARRYAEIPNRYLSFTILDESWGGSDEAHKRFLEPVVAAIRDVSPERCLIARVGEGKVTGRGAAELGIALCNSCTWGEDFNFTFSRISYTKPTMKKAVWPYKEDGEITDGNASMAKAQYADAPDTTAAIAKEYGVGYMIREWGPRVLDFSPIVEKNRYSSETMEAYLMDMVQTMKDRGYGWCYTDFIGSVGIACGFPLVEGAAYRQIENYPFYVDEEMTALFQKVNAVS